MPVIDTLRRRNRRNVPLPPGIDWSHRASPEAIEMADNPYGSLCFSVALGRSNIAAENATYLRLKLVENGGTIIGYHGTSSEAAASIMAEGFRPTRHVESRRIAVSAWDAVVAYEALRFAKDRAARAHEEGEGSIVEVHMVNPHEDNWHGRLEWLGHPERTTALQVYSPEDFRQHIGKLVTRGVPGYDTRDPYAEVL